VSGKGAPLLVAATGNDGNSTGFDSPAKWDFSIAVGSITNALNRSAFSNYGTKLHSQYIVMPGGEEQQGTVSEWAGEATNKCYGTSAAAAYASGVLALYMSDTAYQNPDRAAFLNDVLQQCNNHQIVEHGSGYLPYQTHP
jgi:subtilisin family serine protease